VNDQETRGSETKDDELSIAFNLPNLAFPQESGAFVGVSVKDTRLAEFSIQDFASGDRLQTADDGFYFG